MLGHQVPNLIAVMHHFERETLRISRTDFYTTTTTTTTTTTSI